MEGIGCDLFCSNLGVFVNQRNSFNKIDELVNVAVKVQVQIATILAPLFNIVIVYLLPAFV
jgi:hypothetical protein